MDSKIAFINLANDTLKEAHEQVFQVHDEPTKCLKCDVAFNFLSKKSKYCCSCFLVHNCNVSFTDKHFKIAMKEGETNLFIGKISLLHENDKSSDLRISNRLESKQESNIENMLA